MKRKHQLITVVLLICLVGGVLILGIKHATTGARTKITNAVWSEDHTIDGDVLPDTDNAHDLGSDLYRFAEVHAATVKANEGIGQSQTVGLSLIWKDTPETALALSNQASTVAFTDLDLTAYTSANAKMALLQLKITVDTVGISNTQCYIQVRKNGQSAGLYGGLVITENQAHNGAYFLAQVVVGLDSGQVMEYALGLSASWQIDAQIDVLGYWE